MNIEKIHNLLLSSKSVLVITVLAFVVLRLYPTIYNQPDNWSLWSCLLIQMGIAFALLHLNYTFTIIQKNTFLPTLFYLLFTGFNPDFYSDLKGSIAAFCIVLSYYFLFDSYEKPKSQINALNISLVLVLGSLLRPQLLLLFPIVWIGFYRFQCLNMRVFFANLTGFVIVYLFIFALSLFQGDKNILLSLLPQVDTLFAIQKPNFTISEWLTGGLLIIFCLGIGLYVLFFNISERIWGISVLGYFFFSSLIIFLFYFLQSEYKSTWGLIIYIPVAFLTGYFFSNSNKKSVQYLLLLFFLFLVGNGIIQNMGS